MSGGTGPNPIARTSPDWRIPLLGAAVLTLLCVGIFWDFFFRQVRFAINQQADWGHTLVIPLIAGYFVYLNRERLLARPFRTTWIGFVPVVLGVAMYSVCVFGPEFLGHHNLRSVGVAVTFFGLMLLFLGFRAAAVLLFPFLYVFFFGQTISERFMQIITFRLQDITARGAYLMLGAFGLDVELEGNTLHLFDRAGEPRPLNIAEACSGMRMLMAFLALGIAMAYTGLQRTWQRVVVVLMGVPTAIFVNILRVVTLSLLAIVNSDFAAGDFHSFIGLVWLVPAFLIFLGVIWIVRNLVTEVPVEGRA
ncbi:MAG: exosortase/archaeosortase family protein [Phycisphaerales bacterium]|nr:exosortase/archaeosortase family protein [Phycisphaerales bacterium]NNM25699.1 exosortase/archaeosortase family protein [Phycisphaerales bacterium]